MEAQIKLPQSAFVWDRVVDTDTLICVHCGGRFTIDTWSPRIRCPACLTLGYPDRSGSNLLPLNWSCTVCGADNDGMHNFCVNCGAGLASRCFKCEHPVYTSVCGNCGTRQDQVAQFTQAETRREAWVPILHDKIRQERAREEYQSNRRTDPQYGVADWRQIDLQMRQAVKERQSRHRRQKPAMTAKPRRSYRAWGWVWLLVGVIWLVAANYAQISGSLQHWLQSPEATAVLTMVQDWVPENLVEIVSDNAGWLNNWWIQFTASLNSPPNADGPEYAYLFASTVFGLAALPVLFFLLGKVIQRLFS